MSRSVPAVLLAVLGVAGCTDDPAVRPGSVAAERSVVADADRLAAVLEKRCERVRTCPKVQAAQLAGSLSLALTEGNEVTFYDGRQFHVSLCVANSEHDVWAWYHSEEGTQVGRDREPCTFS